MINLKHVPVRSRSKEVRVISVELEKAGLVTARDIQVDSEVDFVDPDAKICTLEKGTRLVMELYVEQGTTPKLYIHSNRLLRCGNIDFSLVYHME